MNKSWMAGLIIVRIVGVSVNPGMIALIRIPFVPNSRANDLVKPTMADFAETYADSPLQPTFPYIDETFTIDPFPLTNMLPEQAMMKLTVPRK